MKRATQTSCGNVTPAINAHKLCVCVYLTHTHTLETKHTELYIKAGKKGSGLGGGETDHGGEDNKKKRKNEPEEH